MFEHGYIELVLEAESPSLVIRVSEMESREGGEFKIEVCYADEIMGTMKVLENVGPPIVRFEQGRLIE